MVEYLENLPLFGDTQGLPEYDILDRVELYLPRECQQELLIRGFDSMTQKFTELFQFYECLETSEEILHTQVEGPHQKQKPKQSGEHHKSSKSTQRKVSYHPNKTLEENYNKKYELKTKSKKPTCVTSAWTWTSYKLV